MRCKYWSLFCKKAFLICCPTSATTSNGCQAFCKTRCWWRHLSDIWAVSSRLRWTVSTGDSMFSRACWPRYIAPLTTPCAPRSGSSCLSWAAMLWHDGAHGNASIARFSLMRSAYCFFHTSRNRPARCSLTHCSISASCFSLCNTHNETAIVNRMGMF